MKQKTAIVYSEVFKRKVVKEVEDGILTMAQAKTIYDIGSGTTIRRWIDEYGINDSVGKVVHIMSKTEKRENLILKRDLELMKKALADAQVKLKVYEALVDIAHDKYGLDLKKKSILEPSTQSVRNQQKALKELALKRPAKHSNAVEDVTTKVNSFSKKS